MRNRIIAIVTILACSALLPLLSLHRVSAQGPAIEIACPAGATVLPAGQIINPVNGKIRQLLCMDSSGNLTFPGTVGGNIAFGGQLTAAPGNANGFVAVQGTTLGTGNSVIFNAASKLAQLPVVAFAALGTVQAAGNSQYCTDCTTAATCAGAGSGHMAISNGTN